MENEQRGNIIQRLITDKIVFCSPTLSKNDYKNIISNYGDKLIFIKKNTNGDLVDDFIPCLFFRRKTSSDFLIYFHGNAENIFQIEKLKCFNLLFFKVLNSRLIFKLCYIMKTKESEVKIWFVQFVVAMKQLY